VEDVFSYISGERVQLIRLWPIKLSLEKLSSMVWEPPDRAPAATARSVAPASLVGDRA